ncbi:phosphoglycerate dehydrogenase [Thalassoglobus sp. JC818]|uniref:phosphoglycerate dehydrogenase n=1 Tax=Thalassoglobus sp. JC818 TaxID=3232136 RepID=UPI00345AFB91
MSLTVKCCALNSDEGPHFSLLSEKGFEVLPGNRDRSFWEATNLIEELSGCCAVIAGSEPYTPEVIKNCPDLKVIARTGVGFDAVDLEACDRQGIVVTTTPGVNHHSVAEQTIALLMGVSRGFPDNDQRVRSGAWKRIAYPRVMGRTLGLVGLGRIGQAVATRAIGLGLRVVAHEPFPNKEFVEKWKIETLELDDLLGQSDYVSLHNPMTPQSLKMMNRDTFAKMKKGSVFINTARGALVDESALIEALQSGHLRAAGLDVFDVEPLPTSSPLISMSNVLLSGHVAGLDVESQFDTLTMAAETILSLKDGGWPTECIQNLKGMSDWKWDR